MTRSGAIGLPGLTIDAAATGFRDHTLDPVVLTQTMIERIAATDRALKSCVVVDRVGALAAAERCREELKAGLDRGPLHGIPTAIKDIVDVAGMPTRCGSAILRNAPAAALDAPIVARLRALGAVILGKTVTQEFAAGVLSPPARNPWDTNRTPGGSSGGSAVSVAVGGSLLAVGTDTGGSIRIPAAATGVAGFKPAFGTFDLAGVHPLAPSLDTVGFLARTVADLRLASSVLGPGSRPQPSSDLRSVRLGLPRRFFWDRLQPDVVTVVEQALLLLRHLGVSIVEEDWNDAAGARAVAFLINRIESAHSLWPRVADDPDRLGQLNPDLQVRVVGGRLLPAALYVEARGAQAAIRRSMQNYLIDNKFHGMIAPTLPATAVSASDPILRFADQAEPAGVGYTRLTMPFNATGQPVLAVPCGFARDGMPIGFQLVGGTGSDDLLFAVGAAYEQAAGWHRRSPEDDRLGQWAGHGKP